MKLLILIAFAILIVYLIKNRNKAASNTETTGQNAKRSEQNDVESIVQCAFCGVHAPVSEMVKNSSGVTFCSEEHRLRHGAS